MTMNALGGFAVALVFIASNLYIGGFAISDYGCKCGAIGAWVGASIAFVIGLMLTSLFIKAYTKQKKREAIGDYTMETHKLI